MTSQKKIMDSFLCIIFCKFDAEIEEQPFITAKPYPQCNRVILHPQSDNIIYEQPHIEQNNI